MPTLVKTDPRLKQVQTPAADQEVKSLLNKNREVIIITVNGDDDGDANLAVYTKLAKSGGVLSNYLEQVLKNLLRVKNDEPCSQTQAATGS